MGNWPALVPESVWVKAQTRLRAGKMPRLGKGEFPYKGILVCGDCGRKMTGSHSTGRSGKYAYYHCPKCGVRARVQDVEDALFHKIDGLAMEPQALDDLEAKVKELMSRDFTARRKSKAKTQKRLADLEEQLDRLIHLHLTGGIDRGRYDAKRADLEWHIMQARVAYSDADADKVNLINEFHRARQFLLEPGAFWRTASPSERCDTFPLFFDSPLKMSVIE